MLNIILPSAIAAINVGLFSWPITAVSVADTIGIAKLAIIMGQDIFQIYLNEGLLL